MNETLNSSIATARDEIANILASLEHLNNKEQASASAYTLLRLIDNAGALTTPITKETVNIVEFIDELSCAMRMVLESRGINFTTYFEMQPMYCDIDVNAIMRIILNITRLAFTNSRLNSLDLCLTNTNMTVNIKIKSFLCYGDNSAVLRTDLVNRLINSLVRKHNGTYLKLISTNNFIQSINLPLQSNISTADIKINAQDLILDKYSLVNIHLK